VLNIIVFGWIGAIIWGIQMLWIPFWAAGVVNGVGHWWGYRNGKTKDRSRNIVPWGIVIGGEELHNNHHLDPASARLSRRWFEFDIGWMYIRSLSALRLATVK
jgi:stearoyl-CoA desaturase (delta-9 desaturase)